MNMIKGKMKQVVGHILNPENSGLRFVLNFTSQNGTYDSPFEKILAKQWANSKSSFKEAYATQFNFKLGNIMPATCASDIWTINMLVKDKAGKMVPTALDAAMKKVGELAKYEKGSIHISNMLLEEEPTMKDLAVKYFVDNGLNVNFYIEPEKQVFGKKQ